MVQKGPCQQSFFQILDTCEAITLYKLHPFLNLLIRCRFFIFYILVCVFSGGFLVVFFLFFFFFGGGGGGVEGGGGILVKIKIYKVIWEMCGETAPIYGHNH